jgi:lipoprotein-releasing system ATP-binding protein
MNNKKCVLSLTNISKNYYQGKYVVEVLKDINFSIYKGELVSIVGSSGSGKSTFLHIAGLLDTPTIGQVGINTDCDKTKKLSPEQIRLHKIGFVYQYHHLLKDFSARENVAIPAILAGIEKQIAFQNADALLSKLGLEDRLHNMPSQLSGGQQQRVAIARSMINNPSIILADEPTGNLDPKTAEGVFELFLELARNFNTSVVMVTHNTLIAQKMDKIYKMEYGRLIL